MEFQEEEQRKFGKKLDISTCSSADGCQKCKARERLENNVDECDMGETIKEFETWNGLCEDCCHSNSLSNDQLTGKNSDLNSFGINGEDIDDAPLQTQQLSPRSVDFNSLPHVVILNILSFLNIKDLGRTACVSKYLNNSCHYPSLWTHVNISNRRLVTDDVLHHVLSISRNITSLDISESRNITEHGLQTALVNCQSLQELKTVRCDYLTDACLEVVGQVCLDLSVVDFSMCKITDSGMEKVSNIHL
jgi:hypothetical protein